MTSGVISGATIAPAIMITTTTIVTTAVIAGVIAATAVTATGTTRGLKPAPADSPLDRTGIGPQARDP
jgi:hypothetical protein